MVRNDAFDPQRRTRMPSQVRIGLAGAMIAVALGACAPRGGVSAGSPPRPAASAPASLAAAPDQFFEAGAARLRYREAGRREAVIFLHGFMGRLETWTTSGVLDALAREYRVIVLDERGFGESTRFESAADYGLAMADDVIRLLDHLQIRRAHLVGHSMGGVVAANVAARYPDRVVSATLIAPPEYADSDAWERANSKWADDLDRGAGLTAFLRWLFPAWTAEEAAKRSEEALAAHTPSSLAAVIRGMGALMVPATQAASARVPVVVAAGTEDPLNPRGRELAARWPGARFVEVAGADHATIVARPEVLAEMRALIRRASATQRTAGTDTTVAGQQPSAPAAPPEVPTMAARLQAADAIHDTLSAEI